MFVFTPFVFYPAFARAPIVPTITGPDGDFPINPLRGFASGQWPSQVPLLLGTNSNEGETFIYDAVDFYLPA